MSETGLTLIVGDSSVMDVSIYNDDELLDLTEYLILFTVKKPFFGAIGLNPNEDSSAVLVKNSETDGGIVKYSLGSIKINISSTESSRIIDGEYDYDLQISLPSNPDTIITVNSGKINFSKQITSRAGPL